MSNSPTPLRCSGQPGDGPHRRHRPPDAGVKHTVAVAGQSILLNANAPNFGAMYVMLEEFPLRTAHDLSADAIGTRLERDLQHNIRED